MSHISYNSINNAIIVNCRVILISNQQENHNYSIYSQSNERRSILFFEYNRSFTTLPMCAAEKRRRRRMASNQSDCCDELKMIYLASHWYHVITREKKMNENLLSQLKIISTKLSIFSIPCNFYRLGATRIKLLQIFRYKAFVGKSSWTLPKVSLQIYLYFCPYFLISSQESIGRRFLVFIRFFEMRSPWIWHFSEFCLFTHLVYVPLSRYNNRSDCFK